MDCTVTVISTPSIQDYIFGSNTLRENVGASEFVYRATTLWVADVLRDQQESHKLVVDSQKASFGYKEGEDFAAEVVYAGGGNCVILWRGVDHEKRAKQFVYALSQKALVEAPDLPLAAAHVGYTWAGAELSLPGAIEKAIEEIERNRSKRASYVPTLGLGVTAACASTGLPANDSHPDPERTGLASRAHASVIAKWNISNPSGSEYSARDRLQGMFPNVTLPAQSLKDSNGQLAKWEWTEDLDKIGTIKGQEDSYIAVVHADGNAMGQRVIVLGKIFDKFFPEHPRAYIEAIRKLSGKLQQTALNALQKTVNNLRDQLEKIEEDPKDGRRLYSFKDQFVKTEDDSPKGEKQLEKRFRFFPLRPIVFGGDDVTWVCAGIWGLSTAHDYLENLKSNVDEDLLPSFAELMVGLPSVKVEEAKAYILKAEQERMRKQKTGKNDELPTHILFEKSPYACAGVAIVKTHYPFSRAYALSEELVKSAKKRVLALEPTKKANALDWHLATTGIFGSLEQIRQAEYTASDGGKLTARPLLLDSNDTWRTWDNFQQVVAQFQQDEWRNSHNKMLALREALRRGQTGVKQFVTIRQMDGQLPQIAIPPRKEGHPHSQLKHGWVVEGDNPQDDKRPDERRCAHFDAIEIHEMFEPLTIPPHPEEANA